MAEVGELTDWAPLPKKSRSAKPSLRLLANKTPSGRYQRFSVDAAAIALLPDLVVILLDGSRVALRAAEPTDPVAIVRPVSKARGMAGISATWVPYPVGQRFELKPEGDLFLLVPVDAMDRART